MGEQGREAMGRERKLEQKNMLGEYVRRQVAALPHGGLGLWSLRQQHPRASCVLSGF